MSVSAMEFEKGKEGWQLWLPSVCVCVCVCVCLSELCKSVCSQPQALWNYFCIKPQDVGILGLGKLWSLSISCVSLYWKPFICHLEVSLFFSLQFYHEIIHTKECEYKYDNEHNRYLYIHSVCLYMYVYTTEQKVK